MGEEGVVSGSVIGMGGSGEGEGDDKWERFVMMPIEGNDSAGWVVKGTKR